MLYQYNDFFSRASFVLGEYLDDTSLKLETKANYYKIFWARDKDVVISIDGYHMTLMKNHLLFCTPLNMLENDIALEHTVSLFFNREFYCIRDHDEEVSCNGFLFFGSAVPIVVGLSPKETGSFELLFRFFIEELQTEDIVQEEMLRVLLKRLLIKSVRIARKTLVDEEMPTSKLDIIRRFNLLVEMHFRERHKVFEYADLLNISPKSLANLFSKYHTKSPLTVISERIALEGQRLLQLSDKNNTEIATDLGFTDSSHFAKFFKKYTGVPPSTYRNKARKNKDRTIMD